MNIKTKFPKQQPSKIWDNLSYTERESIYAHMEHLVVTRCIRRRYRTILYTVAFLLYLTAIFIISFPSPQRQVGLALNVASIILLASYGAIESMRRLLKTITTQVHP